MKSSREKRAKRNWDKLLGHGILPRLSEILEMRDCSSYKEFSFKGVNPEVYMAQHSSLENILAYIKEYDRGLRTSIDRKMSHIILYMCLAGRRDEACEILSKNLYMLFSPYGSLNFHSLFQMLMVNNELDVVGRSINKYIETGGERRIELRASIIHSIVHFGHFGDSGLRASYNFFKQLEREEEYFFDILGSTGLAYIEQIVKCYNVYKDKNDGNYINGLIECMKTFIEIVPKDNKVNSFDCTRLLSGMLDMNFPTDSLLTIWPLLYDNGYNFRFLNFEPYRMNHTSSSGYQSRMMTLLKNIHEKVSLRSNSQLTLMFNKILISSIYSESLADIKKYFNFSRNEVDVSIVPLNRIEATKFANKAIEFSVVYEVLRQFYASYEKFTDANDILDTPEASLIVKIISEKLGVNENAVKYSLASAYSLTFSSSATVIPTYKISTPKYIVKKEAEIRIKLKDNVSDKLKYMIRDIFGANCIQEDNGDYYISKGDVFTAITYDPNSIEFQSKHEDFENAFMRYLSGHLANCSNKHITVDVGFDM